jgi:hypothetical protein
LRFDAIVRLNEQVVHDHDDFHRTSPFSSRPVLPNERKGRTRRRTISNQPNDQSDNLHLCTLLPNERFTTNILVRAARLPCTCKKKNSFKFNRNVSLVIFPDSLSCEHIYPLFYDFFGAADFLYGRRSILLLVAPHLSGGRIVPKGAQTGRGTFYTPPFERWNAPRVHVSLSLYEYMIRMSERKGPSHQNQMSVTVCALFDTQSSC